MTLKRAPIEKQTVIRIDESDFTGELVIPPDSTSLVMFCHGSGSSRFSPRNRQVAKHLNSHNIGTFLFDLLTPAEDQSIKNRFNINMVSDRLVRMTRELIAQHQLEDFCIGYFGTGTGAAAALRASVELPDRIQAVVCRGGRPDLVVDILHEVQAPTLFIVGEMDQEVIELNDMARKSLRCEARLEIVNSATHLFEEKGTLDRVSWLASGWFKKHLFHPENQSMIQEDVLIPELMEEGIY